MTEHAVVYGELVEVIERDGERRIGVLGESDPKATVLVRYPPSGALPEGELGYVHPEALR